MNRTYPIVRQKTSLWVEILIVLFGVAGAMTFFNLYERAMPSASVDVTISRAQAENIARDYLVQFGYAPQDYKFALSFSGDSSPLYYLQRTLGVEESNRRMAEEDWPLYYWSARWFKPMEKEEFYVYLMPDGEFLGLNHVIKEDAPGADVSQEAASAIAEDFLSQYAGWDSSNWEQVEAASEARPGGRVDHSFEWKSRTFSAGEAELRYTVNVQGDRVGYVDAWIKVPEAFTRQYASERDLAGFLDGITYFLGLVVFLLAGVFGIVMVRPDGRRALWPAILVGVVSLASYINFIPLYPLSYGTTQDYGLFWVMNAVGVVFGAFIDFALVFAVWMGGQALSKLAWPKHDRILARGPERWLTFSRSAWRGLMFGGMQMGYVVLFYLLTSKYLGWWSPVTAEYGNLFATPFPFLYAFDIGLSAALTEELLFRLIGIAFFVWVFRKRQVWLALLIPGALWAFAHSGYVTYPIYVRGIELTIAALFLGFVFLKFDLFTTIMSHFTYNMMIVGVSLLRSNETYYRTSGWIVVLTLTLPLLPGLFWILKRLLGKEQSLPSALTVSPAAESDLAQLSDLPVEADWESLLGQSNRTTLCLRADDELLGFATGFINEQGSATLDGVFVKPEWRRQYWGSTLMDALREHYENEGVGDIRAVLFTDEKRPAAFLHNLFFRPRAQILTPEEFPYFIPTLKKGWQNLRAEFRKNAKEDALEIPRDIP
ncbi:MAG: GNAT family N-acetyltransferase [Anaerolineales bacterium]